MKIRPDRIKQYHDHKQINIEHDPSGYSKAIFEYAERWAELMEKELDHGRFDGAFTVYTTSQMADNGEISSYQHDCAKHILMVYWLYGVRFKSSLIRPFYDEDKIPL